jgi:hypothetical protein
MPNEEKNKTETRRFNAIHSCGHVFEQLAIDHLGKLPKSNGFQYIIVLTDTFSKYAVCKPVEKVMRELSQNSNLKI